MLNIFDVSLSIAFLNGCQETSFHSNWEHFICWRISFLPEGVQDHGEEDKLAEEGDHEGGRGDDLRQQEEEHGEGEKDGDGEADLNRYNRQSDKLISVDSRL